MQIKRSSNLSGVLTAKRITYSHLRIFAFTEWFGKVTVKTSNAEGRCDVRIMQKENEKGKSARFPSDHSPPVPSMMQKVRTYDRHVARRGVNLTSESELDASWA